MGRLIKAGASRKYPARSTFFDVPDGEGYIHDDGLVDLTLKAIDPKDAEKIVRLLASRFDKPCPHDAGTRGGVCEICGKEI